MREALREDRGTHGPVLFLRSFQDDENLVNLGAWAQWTQLMINGAYLSMPMSFEQELAAFLSRRVGPVVKVGGIKERSELRRLKVSDDQWQATVQEYLPRASLIVANAGSAVTTGLLWEIEQVIARRSAEHLLLVVVGGRAAYEQFRESVTGVFPRELPTYQGIGFIGFQQGWEPVWMAIPHEYEARDAFEFALAPAFERIGLPPVTVLVPRFAARNTPNVFGSIERSEFLLRTQSAYVTCVAIAGGLIILIAWIVLT